MQPTRSSRITLAIGALLGAVAIAGSARAAEGPPPRHQPPPEAFTACQGKSTAEACTVAFQDRTIDGSCAPADDNRLFCRPSRPPGAPQPPAEAFAACQGRSESDSCSVSLPDRTVAGTCAASPDGTLFCRPARPPEAR
jgi:hypothetical protein